MRISGMHKGEARRYGLGLIGLAVMLVFLIPLFSIFGSFGLLGYVLAMGGLAVSGFVMLLASTFLPAAQREAPDFTDDPMSREKVQSGPSNTRSNWVSVLDEKDKEKKGEG